MCRLVPVYGVLQILLVSSRAPRVLDKCGRSDLELCISFVKEEVLLARVEKTLPGIPLLPFGVVGGSGTVLPSTTSYY